jgi:hypothetical protein
MKIILLLQIIAALGLLNVWILRNRKSTSYRGGNAKSLKEEFQTYGLPVGMYYLVGFLKVIAAFLFILGIWIPFIVLPAAICVVLLMIGALAMHYKVRDPFKKYIPAISMLILSSAIMIGHTYF